MRPFLSTVEAFLLKSDYKGMRTKFINADEAGRRAMLAMVRDWIPDPASRFSEAMPDSATP